MSDFKRDYLELLKHQVADEIEFLLEHGHDKPSQQEANPCFFCSRGAGFNFCIRIRHLREFQSSIVLELNKTKNPNRPVIGYAVDNKINNAGLLPYKPDSLLEQSDPFK